MGSEDDERYVYGLNEALVDFNSDFVDCELPEFVRSHLEFLKSNLRKSQGEGVGENFESMLFVCDILIDYSWEFLNTNVWVFVNDVWRLVYAYATLYKTIILKLNQTLDDDDFEQKIVKLCDLGNILYI